MQTQQHGQLSVIVIFLGILLAGLAMLFIRYHFSTAEDYWTCQNGNWVQLGMFPLRPKPSTTCPQEADVDSVKRPDVVVAEFYDRYINSPQSMLETKEYQSDDALSPSLKDDLAAKPNPAQDPFFCSSDKPQSVQPSPPSGVTEDKALVLLTEQFTDTIATVSVSLSWEGDAWRMKTVTCGLLPEVQQ